MFEHDIDQPWIVVSHFLSWAREHWPEASWTVQLDPGQIASEWPR